MEGFADYLASINNPQHRSRVEEVLSWVADKYPKLATRIAWNQPMFTDHRTFIIAFSVSKQHMAVAPESAAINHFSDRIIQAGYDHAKELIRIRWDQPIYFSLLGSIIDFNISEKSDYTSFWRK